MVPSALNKDREVRAAFTVSATHHHYRPLLNKPPFPKRTMMRTDFPAPNLDGSVSEFFSAGRRGNPCQHYGPFWLLPRRR